MNNEFFLDFSAALPEDAAEDQVITNCSLCLTCKPLLNHHHNPRFDWTGSLKVYFTLRSKKITQLANLSLQSMLFLRKMERYGAYDLFMIIVIKNLWSIEPQSEPPTTCCFWYFPLILWISSFTTLIFVARRRRRQLPSHRKRQHHWRNCVPGMKY